MKNFISLIVIYLCVTSSVNSQEPVNPILPEPERFTFRYNVVLHVQDSLTINQNGQVEIVQKFSLKYGRFRPNRVFRLEDKVGFRILLRYDSSITPLTPKKLQLGFLDNVDQSSNAQPNNSSVDGGGDDPIMGGLKPVSIPPIDEDDEEGFPVETEEQRFLFNSVGEKQLIFELYTLDYLGRIEQRVSGLRGTFTVTSIGAPYDPSATQQTPQNNDIIVYPNPITSELYIQNPNPTNPTDLKAEVAIYSTTGVQLHKSPLDLDSQSQKKLSYHFNHPELSPGLYVYVITIGDKTYTKTLIKK